MLTVEGCSKTALFREWYNQVFHSLEAQNNIGYDDDFLFQNF